MRVKRREFMDILILGNGFDLAHNLPTSYLDMFNFFKAVNTLFSWREEAKSFNDFIDNNFTDNSKNYEFTRNYLQKAFKKIIENNQFDKDGPIERIHHRLEDNVWYKYFENLISGNQMRGINWIDFESEICKIVKELDEEQKNLYSPFAFYENGKPSRTDKLGLFIQILCSCTYDGKKIAERANDFMYRNVLDKTYADLRRFVECIEIYLVQIVEKMDVDVISSDIKDLSPDKVLSFNYTHTYEKIYNSCIQNNGQRIQYLHGEAKEVGENNMVLGVDEFYLDERKNTCTNYNIFKKFTQRILYETGFEYRNWISIMKSDKSKYPLINTIYIFGHSLDVTDRDVLEEFFRLPKTQVIIYYYHKPQQAQQISNLVKMLGHDDFIEYINASPAKIVFSKQAEMKTKVN